MRRLPMVRRPDVAPSLPAMAVSTTTLRRPGAGLEIFGALAAAALLVAHGFVAARQPLVDLALALLLAFAVFPQVSRAALIGVAALGPSINPALFGLGPEGGGTVAGGRVYAVQAILVLVIMGSVVLALRNGMHGQAAAITILALLIVLVQTVGRPHAGPAWMYRPFQVFLVAFAVLALFHHHRSHRVLLLALAWGSALGCALASVHALVPAIDPFAVSRPDNLPFVSAIGSFTRATGAFTYPNNLGTFAAYSVLLGTAGLLFGRPHLPRGLGWFVVFAGTSALLLAGSRAAGLGLLCGLLYFTVKLAPRRRALILAAEAIVGMVVVVVVLSSPSALEVAQQRVGTAAGQSLALRIEGSRGALEAFASSPIIGTGASESRTDNFWLSYLSQAGILGAALFFLFARKSIRTGPAEKSYPELWVALLLALCTSGLLQDSLGQTLVTWFLGATLGMCALRPAPDSGELGPVQ